MFNRQRTSISNRLLSAIGFLSTSFIIVCFGYSHKLLNALGDNVNPVDICEKINQVRGSEYIAHFILFVTLVLRGWWVTGILNFPFLFYNFAQWRLGKHLLDSTKVFDTLDQVTLETGTKLRFFLLVVFYNLWEWGTWVPPVYIRTGKGYNIMSNIPIYY